MQTCIHSGHSDSNRLICSVGSSSLVVKKPETKTSSSRPLGPGNLKCPFERKAKEFNFVYIPPLPPQNQYSIFLSSPNFASSCEVAVIAANTAIGLPVHVQGRKLPLWSPKRPFWAIRAIIRPAKQPNGHLPENQRYPELPQDMGML